MPADFTHPQSAQVRYRRSTFIESRHLLDLCAGPIGELSPARMALPLAWDNTLHFLLSHAETVNLAIQEGFLVCARTVESAVHLGTVHRVRLLAMIDVVVPTVLPEGCGFTALDFRLHRVKVVKAVT